MWYKSFEREQDNKFRTSDQQVWSPPVNLKVKANWNVVVEK